MASRQCCYLSSPNRPLLRSPAPTIRVGMPEVQDQVYQQALISSQKPLHRMTDYPQSSISNLQTLDFMNLMSSADKQPIPGDSIPTPASMPIDQIFSNPSQHSRVLSTNESQCSEYGEQIDWRNLELPTDVHDLLTGLY